MLALDFLGVPFAGAMHVGIQMPGIGAPMIGVVAGQSERLEQRFELEKNVILAAAKDIGQNGSCVMMLGRRKARYSAARCLTRRVAGRDCSHPARMVKKLELGFPIGFGPPPSPKLWLACCLLHPAYSPPS